MNPWQDRWQSGDVTLYLGDCLEVMPTLVDNSMDAVITDPPYGITDEEWDVVPPALAFEEMFRVSCHQLLWGGQFFDLPNKEGWIVWVKKQPWMTKPFSQATVNEAELLWISKPIKTRVIEYHVWGNVEGFRGEKLKPDYKRPANVYTSQKPVRLTAFIMDEFFADAENVLDPYMGSGTTGVACVQTGRKFIGIEIEERYYRIAQKRIMEAQAQLRMEL